MLNYRVERMSQQSKARYGIFLEETTSLPILVSFIAENLRERGFQSSFSKILRIHRSLFSKILQGKTTLTLEQAYFAAAHLEFDDIETLIFMTVVLMERSEGTGLKSLFEKQLGHYRNYYDVGNALSKFSAAMHQ